MRKFWFWDERYPSERVHILHGQYWRKLICKSYLFNFCDSWKFDTSKGNTENGNAVIPYISSVDFELIRDDCWELWIDCSLQLYIKRPLVVSPVLLLLARSTFFRQFKDGRLHVGKRVARRRRRFCADQEEETYCQAQEKSLEDHIGHNWRRTILRERTPRRTSWVSALSRCSSCTNKATWPSQIWDLKLLCDGNEQVIAHI